MKNLMKRCTALAVGVLLVAGSAFVASPALADEVVDPAAVTQTVDEGTTNTVTQEVATTVETPAVPEEETPAEAVVETSASEPEQAQKDEPKATSPPAAKSVTPRESAIELGWHTWQFPDGVTPRLGKAGAEKSWFVPKQTYVGEGKLTPPCGVYYQQDKYQGKAGKLAELIEAGITWNDQKNHASDNDYVNVQDWWIVYGGDCATPNSLTLTHVEYCGGVDITLRNVSPWIYPTSVKIDGVHSYGPTVDNRTNGGLNGPQKDASKTRTITFPEDSGTHTVEYRIDAGSENQLYLNTPLNQWVVLTIETDCVPPIEPECPQVNQSTVLTDPSFVDNKAHLSVTGNWVETTLDLPFSGKLKNIGTIFDIDADPIQYVGIHFTLSDGRTIVFEEESSYNGNLWSIDAFAGVNSGLGYAAFGSAEEFIAQNGELDVASVKLLYTSPVASETAVTSVSYGCTTVTFTTPPPTPVAAQFDVEPLAPTCNVAGTFDTSVFPIEREGYILDVDRPFDGPGVYTITATAKPGFVIEGSLSKDVTVLGATGYQSVDPQIPCFEPINVTLAPPVIVDECGTENDGVFLPEDSEGVTYRWEGDDVVAVLDPNHVVAPIPAGWVQIDTGAYLYEVNYEFTDEPCGEQPEPESRSTVIEDLPSCEDTEVTRTETFYETPYVWLNDEWVLGEEVQVNEVVTIREATNDDYDALDCGIVPGDVLAQCVSAVPYLAYDLDAPQSGPLTITWIHPSDPSQNIVWTDQPRSGVTLWPGASDVEPLQWPGWELVGGEYLATDGNFAWTRYGVTVEFSINPTYSVVVEYPEESALCANPPLPPEETPPGLALTGGGVAWGAGILGALAVLAGIGALVLRRRNQEA